MGNNNLASERARKNMSQKELADALGTSTSSIHRYESSTSTLPAEIAIKAAGIFGCSIDYLYDRTDERLPRLMDVRAKYRTAPYKSHTDFSEVESDKSRFVESNLSSAVCDATHGWVEDMFYASRADTTMETVIAVTRGGDEIVTNITFDSHWAILKDVIRELADWYE